MTNKFQEHQTMCLERARHKHGGAITTAHQGYALILEELDEFWLEIKAKSQHRSKERMYQELVDIAVICQRVAEDLGLYES